MTRSGRPQQLARLQQVVHELRAAATGRLAQHRDGPGAIGAGVAQRVLAHARAAEIELDVVARLGSGKRNTVGALEAQRHHLLGDNLLGSDDHLAVEDREPRHAAGRYHGFF